MRCVLLVKRFWPACGGVERYVGALSRALAAEGHDTTVVTGAHAPNLAPREVVDDVQVYRFSAQRSPLRCAYELSRLRRIFRRADVVHVSDTEMLDYFWRMMGWQVIPNRLCMTVHGMSCVYPVPQDEITRARRARRLVDGMIHDGAFIGKWLGVAPDRIAAQGLQPVPAAIPEAPEPAADSAIYLGRLEPDTGVDLYLDALRVLRHEWKIDLPLHIYGDGSLRAQIAQQSQAQALRVIFHGCRPDAQEQISRHTLAFVSGRMAIHEALARRRAVIAAFTNPIRADYVRNEAFSPFIATGGSGAELAERARRLLANSAERRRVTERGWQHVRDHSWSQTARTYVDFWNSCRPAQSRPAAWSARVRLARQLWREARGPCPAAAPTRAENQAAVLAMEALCR